jgi:dCMP deaminase
MTTVRPSLPIVSGDGPTRPAAAAPPSPAATGHAGNEEGLARVRARPSWDGYFMQFALLARSRATCIRRAVGAVIVKERHVLATGYNGAPKGLAHAEEVGCLRSALNIPSGTRHEICRGLHAEQNAIIQAAYHGIAIAGADMYVTTHPCSICAKMIINAGIQKVFFLEGYADPIAKMIIDEAQLAMVPCGPGGLDGPEDD